jgi:hypothetical protein
MFQDDPTEYYRKFEMALWEDIVDLKIKYSEESTIESLNYLQLSIFTTSMGYFNVKGLFSYTYDSMMLSVCDNKISIGDELIIENHRFWNLLYSLNEHIAYQAEMLLIEWLKEFYYCSYSFGCLPQLGYDFWEPAKSLSMNQSSFGIENLLLLSNMFEWNRQYKKEGNFDITIFLKKQLEKITSENELKAEIYIQLITIEHVPLKEKVKYYNILKKRIQFHGHLEIQLLAAITTTLKEFYKRYKQIFDALKKYNDSLKKVKDDPILLLFKRVRILRILNGLIILLAENGQTRMLTKLLASFYDINGDLNNSILYILPTFQKGILYSYEKKVLLKVQDTYSLNNELINISNKLFSRTIAMVGNPELIIKPTREMGIPSEKYSKEFEQKIIELYHFDFLNTKFSKKVSGLLQLGFKSIPIQSLMLKQLGYTYPIVTSLCNTAEQSSLNNVLIWTTGSITSGPEQSVLVHLCKKYNYNYEIVNETQLNKEKFIEVYESDKYSILWVASHGEFKNFEPQKSLINISSDESISLEELMILKPKNKDNRLLVMNFCEGGLNFESGGFKEVGIAHQLTSTYQSVTSHLWMVNPIMAMVYGNLLAIAIIAKKYGFFKAHCYAVINLQQGKENTVSELKKEMAELEDVIEIISNTGNLDWEDILNWGSTAYYT